MSQENVDRFRAAIVAWNDGDVGRYLAATDPSVTYHTSGAFLPHDPVYRRHAGLRRDSRRAALLESFAFGIAHARPR